MEPNASRPDPLPNTPRLGRPRLLTPAYERELVGMAGVASTHGAHALHYAAVATRALFALDQPGWVPHDEVFTHFVKPNGGLKWSMLSELGRISDAPTLCAVARLIGQQRLPAAQAVTVIRRIRVGDVGRRSARLASSSD
jgi:hypothetical protein